MNNILSILNEGLYPIENLKDVDAVICKLVRCIISLENQIFELEDEINQQKYERS